MKYQIYLSVWIVLSCCVGVVRAQKNVLVLNKSSNSLSILDPVTLKTIATIPTGESPHELIVSQDRQLAIVANYGNQQPGNSLSIIDLKQQKEIRRVNLGAILRPHSLAIRNHQVYFTAEMSRLVGRYDLGADSIDWINGTGQSGSHMLALHPDGKTVYTANRLSHTVSKIEIGKPDSTYSITQIVVGQKPEGLDISPDGKEVWVGSNVDGKITVLDAATDQKIAELPAGEMSIRIKFSANQQLALVSDSKLGKLFLFDAVKKQLLTQLTTGGAPMGIVLSADNKFAYASLSQTNEVIKLSLPDLKIVARSTVGNNPDGIGCLQ